MFREFAIAKLVRADRFEELTAHAYQTVKIDVLTQNKKRMPDFKTLLPNTAESHQPQSVEDQRSLLKVFALKHGLKFRKGTKHGR